MAAGHNFIESNGRLIPSAAPKSVKASRHPIPGTGHAKGKSAEVEVAAILCSMGFPAVLAPHPSPFDIDCAGVRVEVKFASLCYCDKNSIKNHWQFNIHRHGVVNESEVDVYVLVCGGSRVEKCRYFLVVPAPLAAATYQVSIRSLKTRHLQYLNRWEIISQSRIAKIPAHGAAYAAGA